MLSHKFITFLVAAQAGSFTAASRQLYISATSVMKQINQLEEETGLILFERSRTGLVLTPAGKAVYDAAAALQKQAEAALQHARSIQESASLSLRIGTSILNPAAPFMEIWNQIYLNGAPCQVLLVPFQDDHTGILDVIDSIGQTCDLVAGICDSRAWLERISFYPLYPVRKMIAVPRQHPLASRNQLTLQDLHGQKLMMVSPGDSAVNDEIRSFLTGHHPQIELIDAGRYYDMQVFNRAVQENCLLLNLECWKHVHPGLVTLPVDWSFTIPFGLLYASDSSPAVRQFLKDLADWPADPAALPTENPFQSDEILS